MLCNYQFSFVEWEVLERNIEADNEGCTGVGGSFSPDGLVGYVDHFRGTSPILVLHVYCHVLLSIHVRISPEWPCS